MQMITTINPATGSILQEYAPLSTSEIEKAIAHTQQAFLNWRKTTLSERAQCMQRVAELLLAEKHALAKLITSEMGKALTAAETEIEKCAKACRYFAEKAPEFLAPQPIPTEMQKSNLCYEPLGILFAIMPWNFPFWQVFRYAAPNLMAGNATILKHAPIVTGCGLAIAKLFEKAGFPKHLFTAVVIAESQAESIIQHPDIIGVTLTGSVKTGRIVAALAGKFGKKVVLELGGNDPYLILEDADLEKAAEICVRARLLNSGQVCIAPKRFIAVKSIQAEFQKHVMAEISKYTIGDPLDPATQLGPLARADLRKHLQMQIDTCIAQGANLLVGGKIPEGPGFYYPITVLDNIHKGILAYEEELFGPVIALITAEDAADAIHIANDSPYGLSAAVFTRDTQRGEKIAREEIQAGICYVNDAVSSDPRLPFGGIKASGFGRELGKVGMLEFVNVKTVGVGS